MTIVVCRRRLLHAGLACGMSAAGVQARACEFFSNTLRVTHPWARATADDDTSAVVSMRFDEVQQDDRLIGIQTLVATGAELGGQGASAAVDFAIPKGQQTQLSESGTYLRLLGLTHPLEVGRAYPMQLTFAVGGVLRAELSIDYARFR